MRALQEQDPRQIGRYRLLRRLGAGGMGQVFLGAAGDGRLVAVKVVHPGVADDERFRVRFAREVQLSRRVSGPWAAAVVDADPDAVTPWLATEYVPGPSLDQAVQAAGPLPEAAVRVLAVGVARAIAGIHAVELVHRDVKPSKVLLAADGPRLIDFGISRAVDGTGITTTGVVGTAAFLSPEQADGGVIGPESDVFSLGAVLVLAANGVGPFGEGSPMVVLERIRTGEPELGELTEPVRGLVAACLRRDPAERPTAVEVVEQLTPALPAEGDPGWLPPAVTALLPRDTIDLTPEATTASRWPVRRLSRRTLLFGAGAVGVVGAAAGGIAGWRGLAPQPRMAWTFAAGGPVTALALGAGAVFVGGEDATVSALDVATGRVRWAGQVGGRVAEMAVHGGWVFVDDGATTRAFDETSGRRGWERLGRLVAAADGQAITIERDDRQYQLRAITPDGTPRWSQPVTVEETTGYINGGWASMRGRALISTPARLDAISMISGDVDWSRGWQMPTVGAHNAFTTAGELVFVLEDTSGAGGARCRVTAVDPLLGTPRWEQAHDQPARLAADGTAVYAAGTSAVAAFSSTTGTRLWTWDLQRDLSDRVSAVDVRAAAALPGGAVALATFDTIHEQGRDARTAPCVTAGANGSRRWRLELDPLGDSDGIVGPQISDRSVILAVGPQVRAITVEQP